MLYVKAFYVIVIDVLRATLPFTMVDSSRVVACMSWGASSTKSPWKDFTTSR
jgi:hypothetical protein